MGYFALNERDIGIKHSGEKKCVSVRESIGSLKRVSMREWIGL